MSTIVTTRRFIPEDQDAFARLSGDCNPLHVDPLQARRLLFGGSVVHGIHLALWALDRLAAAGFGITALAALELKFDAAALVGDATEMEQPSLVGDEIRVRLRSGARRLARFRFTPAAVAPSSWRNPGPPPAEPCIELGAAAIATSEGTAPLGYDTGHFTAMFPALAGFAPAQIAWLLAGSRVVGMRLPGRHSIFLGLRASFGSRTEAARITYRAADWDDRFQLVTIALSGGGDGRAFALLRPAPVDQPSLAAIAARVAPDRFATASVLVVGGSRGLGEAAVKLFAGGGAKVTLTYREGADEANRLAAEIAAVGGCAAAVQLDVAAPGAVLDGTVQAPFTHVVYCAAPRIRKGGTTFDAALHARYAEIFARGLEQLLRAVEPHLAPAVTLVVPSTSYIDRPEAGFTEYAAAKASGEAVAREAADRLVAAGRQVRLIVPRFRRLRTDQTAQVGGSDATDPADALLAAL